MDELAADSDLLRDWVSLVSVEGRRQAALLVHPGGAAPEGVPELITTAMATVGIEADTELDIEAFAVPLSPAVESELARRCTYALTPAPLTEPFDRLIPLA